MSALVKVLQVLAWKGKLYEVQQEEDSDQLWLVRGVNKLPIEGPLGAGTVRMALGRMEELYG